MQRAALMDGIAEREARSAGPVAWYRTSVGQKAIMAATGAILTLFVLFHLLGNLQIFQGEEALNRYARLLRVEPGLLWAARIVLLASAILHVTVGTLLYFENRRARSWHYSSFRPVQASLASRTMIFSGVIVLAFIVYHLLNLTFGTAEARGYSFEPHNVYQNVIAAFRDPFITIVYVVGQVPLYLHLSHGIQSMCQSAGWKQPRYDRLILGGGKTLALIVAAGNIVMPLTVLAGWVH